MSTEKEKMEAIRCAVEIARNRLIDLDTRKDLGIITKAEVYERDQTLHCIKLGTKLLTGSQPASKKKE